MVARRLWTITSLHVDENEDHDWVVEKFNRAVNGARAVVRAMCGPMKLKWLRAGVKSVKAVSIMIRHQNGHVDKTHYDDFIAASLNSFFESNFRTNALAKVVTGCNQRTGKFLCRKVDSEDGAYWWKPESRRSQECIGELGLAGGKVPSTSDMKDAVRKHTEAEDKLIKVESKKFQRLTSSKMFFHSLDDSTIQFEMAMVMDMCTSTVGARPMGYCSMKPTLPQAGQSRTDAKVHCGCIQCVR